MAESFSCRPDELGGFSNMFADLGNVMVGVNQYIHDFVRPTDRYTGVLEIIAPVSHRLADVSRDVLGGRASTAALTSQELNITAWQYWQAEDANARAFGAGAMEGAPFEGSVQYQMGNDPREQYANAPESGLSNPDEVAGQIDGLFSTFVDIAEFVADVNVVRDILGRLIGDWQALDKAGHALVNAGNALSRCDEELQNGLKRLDPHWNGGAAQAFTEFHSRYTHAIRDQGAAYRILGEIYKAAAVGLSKLAEKTVEKLNEIMNDIFGKGFWSVAGKVARKFIPIYGQAELIAKVVKAIDVIVNVIGKLKDAAEALFNAMRDGVHSIVDHIATALASGGAPSGAELGQVGKVADAAKKFHDAQGKVAELEEKYNETRDRVEKGIIVGTDLAELTTTPHGMAQEPDQPYEAGKSLEESRRSGV